MGWELVCVYEWNCVLGGRIPLLLTAFTDTSFHRPPCSTTFSSTTISSSSSSSSSSLPPPPAGEADACSRGQLEPPEHTGADRATLLDGVQLLRLRVLALRCGEGWRGGRHGAEYVWIDAVRRFAPGRLRAEEYQHQNICTQHMFFNVQLSLFFFCFADGQRYASSQHQLVADGRLEGVLVSFQPRRRRASGVGRCSRLRF